MAAKDRRRFVRQSDIKSAFIKVGIGEEKRSKVISDKEKRITAYHETGHAILFHMLPDMEAVYTISIIPTGPGAAGYTMPQPENDDMFQTRGKMMQYITVCLGGRVGRGADLRRYHNGRIPGYQTGDGYRAFHDYEVRYV